MVDHKDEVKKKVSDTAQYLRVISTIVLFRRCSELRA